MGGDGRKLREKLTYVIILSKDRSYHRDTGREQGFNTPQIESRT